MTMLERARAAAKREINRLRKVYVPEYPGSWKTHEGLGWENIDDVAEATIRAVLMAVREPDDRSLDAASDVGPDTNNGGFSHDDARTVFTAMIDAILNEDQP